MSYSEENVLAGGLMSFLITCLSINDYFWSLLLPRKFSEDYILKISQLVNGFLKQIEKVALITL